MCRLALIVLLGSVALSAYSSRTRPAGPAGNETDVSDPRLQRLVGRWYVTASTFGGPADSAVPTFVATPAALGRAVHSVWRQGSGATAYEANALWAHDSVSHQLRVFEANSLGVADMHVGEFDHDDALVLELRSPGAGNVIQRRVFAWSGDTLRMSAQFPSTGRTINHAVTLVRRQ